MAMNFNQFMGTPTKQPHETFNLPDAYHGKNQHLEDVLDFMIRKEDEFYTQRLLPWKHTDELHVEWDIFKFNRSIMDVEPEQGIPRLVTSEMDTKSDNLLRRGLAFIIEHGFMTTERGRRTFMLNLQQITDAVHTTAYHGVMTALLGEEDAYVSKKRMEIRKFRKTERSRWACVQKSHKGLYVLDAELKYEMARKQVVPNTWVFPPKMSIYLDMAAPEQTQYQLKGPLAAGNLEEDRTNKGISWRGTSVFESQPFDVEFTDEPDDLLSQSRQCGEYFHFKTNAAQRADPAHSYIQIYDATTDMFEKITLQECQLNDLMNTSVYWEVGQEFSVVSMELLQKFSGRFTQEVRQATAEALMSGIPGEQPRQISSSVEFTQADLALRTTLTISMLLDDEQVLADWLLRALGRLFTRASSLWRRGDIPTSLSVIGPIIAEIVFRSIREGNCTNKGDFDALTAFLQEIIETRRVEPIVSTSAAPKTKPASSRSKSKEAPELQTPEADIGDSIKMVCGIVYDCLHHCLFYIRAAQNLKSTVQDYIIFRPFQTYTMSSALLAAGGAELGSTFHGHHDFQLSDDIIRKVHVGHYTHYSKSVVKQPKRFTVARYVYAQSYLYGETTEFYTKQRLLEDTNSGETGISGSLLVFSIDPPARPLTHAINALGIPNPLIVERTIPEDTINIHERIRPYMRDCEPDPTSEDYDNSQKFDTDRQHLNYDCFPGATIDENGCCTQKNMGHWGDLTYPGCMRVREGEIMHIEKEKILIPGQVYQHKYTPQV
jgi:hypothetical protein